MKLEQAKAVTDAGIFLSHAEELRKRLRAFKEMAYGMADDMAAMEVMLDTGTNLANNTLSQTPGHAPKDVELTRQEREDRDA